MVLERRWRARRISFGQGFDALLETRHREWLVQKLVSAGLFGVCLVRGSSRLTHEENWQPGEPERLAYVLAELEARFVRQSDVDADDLGLEPCQVTDGAIVVARRENVKVHLGELFAQGVLQPRVIFHEERSAS